MPIKLKSLKLSNFQAHKELVIPLSPGITSIRGPTDRGKSSILRALRWVCLNDFGGDDFVREGAKKTIVTLETKDHTIIRTKGTGGALNTYRLETASGEDEFKSFGVTVPSPIAALLQLDEINFQGQHESPFWFAETAGEVSRKLNRVVDLNIIDEVLSNIASEVRTATERKTVSEERLQQAEGSKKELEPQRLRVEQFEQLLSLRTDHQNTEEAWVEFNSQVDRIEEARSYKMRTAAKAKQVEAVFLLGEQARVKNRKHSRLNQLIAEIESAKMESAPPPSFAPVERTFKAKQETGMKALKLSSMISSILSTKEMAERYLNVQKVAEQKFHSTIKGARCPICQKTM